MSGEPNGTVVSDDGTADPPIEGPPPLPEHFAPFLRNTLLEIDEIITEVYEGCIQAQEEMRNESGTWETNNPTLTAQNTLGAQRMELVTAKSHMNQLINTAFQGTNIDVNEARHNLRQHMVARRREVQRRRAWATENSRVRRPDEERASQRRRLTAQYGDDDDICSICGDNTEGNCSCFSD
jgi:hypothetical protein